MHGVLLAKLAEFFQLEAILERLLILSAVIVDALTLCALKFDEIILRHIFRLTARA